MTSALAWRSVLALAASASACLWHDYDPVTEPESLADAVSPNPPAPAQETSDASEVGDVSVAADANSSLACEASSVPAETWTFEATTQGWTSYTDTGVNADLTWSATVGDPSPGSLSYAVSSGDGSNQGAWVHYTSSLGDLTGRTIAAWVFLSQGASPHLKVYAQTGSTYAWGDSGTLWLPTGQWTCVSLTLSTPAYNQPEYDPSDVIAIGFETLAVDSFELFIDSVQIY